MTFSHCGIALIMKFLSQVRVASFNDTAREHDMRELWNIVFEQSLVVGDDQRSHLRTRQLPKSLADDSHSIAIEPAIGFVKNRKFRL